MDTKIAAINQQIQTAALNDPSQIGKLNQISDAREKAEAVAGQLEGLFTQMMMKAMRETVPEGGLMGQGLGGKMYLEMLDQQMIQSGGGPIDAAMHDALVRELMETPDKARNALQALNNSPHPIQHGEPGIAAQAIEEGGKGKTSGF